MKTATTKKQVKEFLEGKTPSQTGFVPTMGALHKGHIALVERARGENEVVVVSVFVNPTQFNDPGDLSNYPRTPEMDMELLAAAGADLVFMPAVEEMYPQPDTRQFDFGALERVMEGATRPGHFNGVAQIVSKLFEIVAPGKAYFGEKDFQQIAVVREMVRQLALTVKIVACPTVREADGLAMSSRNTLLPPGYRAAAPNIYKALRAGAAMAREGKLSPREVERAVAEMIDSDLHLKTIYFQAVNARTLQPAESWNEKDGVRGCTAVQAGNVRLIDNIELTV